MAKLTKLIILCCLSVGGLASCGGPAANASPKTSSIVSYRFTATIESYSAEAPLAAAVGDSISGTFKYDPTAISQRAPSMMQVIIGTTVFNADLIEPNSIVITNDTVHTLLSGESTPQKSDIFSWTVNNSAFASQFGLDNFQIVISLHDPTGTVFNNSLIPSQLDLNNFSDSSIFLNEQVHNGGGLNIGRAKITSLIRE